MHRKSAPTIIQRKSSSLDHSAVGHLLDIVETDGRTVGHKADTYTPCALVAVLVLWLDANPKCYANRFPLLEVQLLLNHFPILTFLICIGCEPYGIQIYAQSHMQ
uniref:Uncharacterized protein n=1 Tax=Schistocephalus solidus TaxID=70667 RepID=A0A0V0JA75_SCHSO